MSLIKSILGPGINSAVTAATSFVVTGATKKVSEAASTVFNTFGGTADLKKIAAEAKSFEQMDADRILKGMNAGPQSLMNLAGTTMPSNESAATASQINAATGQTNGRSLHKVILQENGTNNVIVFEVMPEIVEQHTIEYESVAPPQFPGSFQKYKGNSATQWQLNATLISRNTAEATKNFDYLMMLRGWTKPYFGDRTAIDFQNKLGAPPPVLTFSGLRDLVGPVPVVITSLNWTWPKDVDYIATSKKGSDGNYIPFPTVMTIPIQLVESFSITQFNEFSLSDYRAGRMMPAFNKVANTAPAKEQVSSEKSNVNEFGRTSEEQLQYMKDNTTIT